MNMKHPDFKKRFGSTLRSLAAMVCLASLPFTCLDGFAQTPAAPNKLFIQIIDGEGALNDIRARTAREPIVEVQDENHKPVAGALVLFTTPGSGPSGVFPGGLTSFKATTGADGRATATGLKPNSVSGQFQIQVTATLGEQSTVAVINQTNTGKPASVQSHAAHGIPMKAFAIIGAVAAGGAVTGILLTRGTHSDTITPGAPTVGAP
jgi:hypothetical protein